MSQFQSRARRSLWLSFLLGVAAFCLGDCTARAAEKPLNVLFIAVDDLRPELGTYGNALVKTPHLDKLAATGVRFDRAYCQFPLCNPSRSSLLTGRYPDTTGVLDSVTWFQAAHPDFVSLPQFFKNNGYATLRAGKIFHGGLDDADAWSEGGKPRTFVGAQRPPKVKDLTKPDRFEIVEGDGRELTDFQTASAAEQFLEKYRDQPFFLAVGFIATHSPFIAPRRFFEYYDTASMPLPVDFATRPTTPIGFPVASVPLHNIDVFANRDATPEAAREMIRAYLATASLVDAQAGRVLNKLDQLGLADNTIVVFFGDHGYHLGEKGKWSKHDSLFEVGARVPLIVRWPQAAGNGTASTRIVQLLDIFPTLAEAARLAPPYGLEGHSLTALLQEPSAPWNHPAMTMAASPGLIGKSIRTERWRYVEWNDGAAGRLLFDHAQDPCELVNLAEEPVLEETVNDLSKALRR